MHLSQLQFLMVKYDVHTRSSLDKYLLLHKQLCLSKLTPNHKNKSNSTMAGGQQLTSWALLLETMTRPVKTSRTRWNDSVFHLVLPPSPPILERKSTKGTPSLYVQADIPSWCGTVSGIKHIFLCPSPLARLFHDTHHSCAMCSSLHCRGIAPFLTGGSGSAGHS